MRQSILSQRRRRLPGGLATLGGLAVVVMVAAAAVSLGARAADSAAPSGVPAASPTATPVAQLIARIPTAGPATFAWSLDGAMLLVSDVAASHVYDRAGKLLATFPPAVGWLDATHLVAWDGVVSDARQSREGSSPAGTRVLGSGHGAAAIVVGTATCDADPLVTWFRNGALGAAPERANPLGWSADGATLLLGHGLCLTAHPLAGTDTPTAGSSPTATPSAAPPPLAWQGNVDVVEFATGKVEQTVPGVRGVVSFGVDPDMIAARTVDGTAIVDESGGLVTLSGAAFLGWLDSETIFVERDGQILVADLDPPQVVDGNAYAAWQSPGPNGLHLAADLEGNATALLREDGSTLLDLSAAQLVLVRHAAAANADETALLPGWWAPDGRTVALAAADGNSIQLISL